MRLNTRRNVITQNVPVRGSKLHLNCTSRPRADYFNSSASLEVRALESPDNLPGQFKIIPPFRQKFPAPRLTITPLQI